jgi:hypothetical protein
VYSFNVVVSQRLSLLIQKEFILSETLKSEECKPIHEFAKAMKRVNNQDIEEEDSITKSDYDEALSRIKKNVKKYIKRNSTIGPIY